MLEKVINVLDHFPRTRVALKKLWYLKKYLFRRREGVQALHNTYARVHGRSLDIQHPSTFTEKMFCKMIIWHQRDCGQLTSLADKFLVRSYVAARIGAQHLAKIYWHGKTPSEIPYDRLPSVYVLKTNHGSAQVIKIAGSIDKAQVASVLKKWLSTNHYWKEREYQYLGIRPQILAEELLDDGFEGGPLDYRFWCFSGVPHLIQVDNFQHDINPFYDCQWRRLNLSYRANAKPAEIPKPHNLDSMLDVASSLARDFDFVRVDLYNIHGRIIFGELTFTPVAGFLKFQPDSWDIELGRLWNLEN